MGTEKGRLFDMKILKQREKDRKKLIQMAVKYVKEARRQLGPLTAILFGSISRGDYHSGSDIDILIISEGLPEHPLRRLAVLYEFAPPPVEPVGWKPQEWLRLKERKGAFHRILQKEGQVLADDLHLFPLNDE